jgi:hypothetical protein
MALPVSEVALANISLDFIGGDRVSTINPPVTDTEIIVSRHFENVRQDCLRGYVPNFAKKRANLVKLVEAPLFDFTDSYQLPADFIRLLSVGGDREEDQLDATNFDIQGNNLYVNYAGALTAPIRYIADISDVSKWDAGFRQIFVIQLALAIVVQITDDPRKAAFLANRLEKKMPDVYGVDAQEKPATVIDRSRILARRKGLTGAYDRNTNQFIYFDQ